MSEQRKATGRHIKKYLDINVVDATKERFDYIYSQFDDVYYMFSGGKDSMVCIEHGRSYHREHNLGPVKAIFIDEEILPDCVIDVIKRYKSYDDVCLNWIVRRIYNSKFCIDETERIVMWGNDSERPNGHVREVPYNDATLIDLNAKPIRQQDMDEWVYTSLGMSGKVAFILGTRADESLVRLASFMHKTRDIYITESSYLPVKLVKPIYDWNSNDVFKWLFENSIEIGDVYNQDALIGGAMRTATPLHAEAKRYFQGIAEKDPDYYERICKAFPDMRAHASLYKFIDKRADYVEYIPKGVQGCIEYARKKYKGNKLIQALNLVKSFKRLHEKSPDAYPIRQMLMALSNGSRFSSINPVAKSQQEAEKRITEKLLKDHGKKV